MLFVALAYPRFRAASALAIQLVSSRWAGRRCRVEPPRAGPLPLGAAPDGRRCTGFGPGPEGGARCWVEAPNPHRRQRGSAGDLDPKVGRSVGWKPHPWLGVAQVDDGVQWFVGLGPVLVAVARCAVPAVGVGPQWSRVSDAGRSLGMSCLLRVVSGRLGSPQGPARSQVAAARFPCQWKSRDRMPSGGASASGRTRSAMTCRTRPSRWRRPSTSMSRWSRTSRR